MLVARLRCALNAGVVDVVGVVGVVVIRVVSRRLSAVMFANGATLLNGIMARSGTRKRLHTHTRPRRRPRNEIRG